MGRSLSGCSRLLRSIRPSRVVLDSNAARDFKFQDERDGDRMSQVPMPRCFGSNASILLAELSRLLHRVLPASLMISSRPDQENRTSGPMRALRPTHCSSNWIMQSTRPDVPRNPKRRFSCLGTVYALRDIPRAIQNSPQPSTSAEHPARP